ncbi:MAG TPA: delta-60 repeat domain-containing protein [Verrucomicrobiae bacterium]
MSLSAVLFLAVAAAVRAQTLDSFNPGANNSAGALVVQPDGKILAGGNFTVLAGQWRYSIGRLEADGKADRRFAPAAVWSGDTPMVRTMVAQTDGKIIIGGLFTNLSGMSCNSFARLNADGTPDTNFTPVIIIGETPGFAGGLPEFDSSGSRF